MTWYPAGHGQRLHAPSRALSSVLRLQLLFRLSFTHGWETTKEPAQGLYWLHRDPRWLCCFGRTVLSRTWRPWKPHCYGASEPNGRNGRRQLLLPLPPLLAVLLVSLAMRQGAAQSAAGSVDHRPVLQDLDVITAVRGIRSGQATYVAKTLAMNFWSDLGWHGILSMVLLLMDQRWDLSNYLRGRLFRASSPDIACPRCLPSSCSCWNSTVKSNSSMSVRHDTPNGPAPHTHGQGSSCLK